MIGGSTDTIVARFRITACNGKPVQGALVYATAVPFNQFTIPAERSHRGSGEGDTQTAGGRPIDGHGGSCGQAVAFHAFH